MVRLGHHELNLPRALLIAEGELMIIWGTKYLDKIEREGEFYCPSCQTRRPFRLWKKRMRPAKSS